MYIEFHNDFHNSWAKIRVKQLPAELTDSQVRRLRNKLCGISDCCCSDNTGVRGVQDYNIVECYDGEKIYYTVSEFED